MGGLDRALQSFRVIEEIGTSGLKWTVLKTAMELDVFTTIAGGKERLKEIAQATRCSIRGMRVLLDALCPLGLLSMRGSSPSPSTGSGLSRWASRR